MAADDLVSQVSHGMTVPGGWAPRLRGGHGAGNGRPLAGRLRIDEDEPDTWARPPEQAQLFPTWSRKAVGERPARSDPPEAPDRPRWKSRPSDLDRLFEAPPTGF